MRHLFTLGVLLLACTAMLTGGCATGKEVRSISPTDNPQHHYLRGMEALETGNIAVAQEKFERSLYCDAEYSPAHAGQAIVAALKAREQKDRSFQAVEVERASGHLARSKDHAESPEDRFDYHLAAMRVATTLKEKGWLERVEDEYNHAGALKVDGKRLIYYQGKEAAAYFMGLAYQEGQEFQKARDRFSDVLNAGNEGKWHEKADLAWKKTDKIVRAIAGITVGDVGKKIAVQDAVSRADMAALLIDELKIDKLLAGRMPVRSELDKMKPEFVPADILSNPFKEEILTIMKWKVRGLEPRYDKTTRANLFMPADDLLRGEMALVLEDVLVKLTGNEKLATAFFDHDKSPFPDVRPSSPVYNAVMNMTTRGIMLGEYTGEFRVNQPVDGAEALLAIRVLKQQTNIH